MAFVVCCSVTYSCLQFVVMTLRFQGSLSPIVLLMFPSITVILAWVLFFYLWSFLFLRARNSYNNDTSTLSVKEYSFLVYSVTLFGETFSGSIFYLIGVSQTGKILPQILSFLDYEYFFCFTRLLFHYFATQYFIYFRTNLIGKLHTAKFVVT